MKQWLEMEIGITGGEEDGVNNEDVDNNSLYTQPEDIYEIYSTLSKISPYFSIAAGFGNVHGVYSPGNVKLHPELLSKHQNQYVLADSICVMLMVRSVKEKIGGSNPKPVFLVFHGGSGSSKQEARFHCLSQYTRLTMSSSQKQSPMVSSKSTLILTSNGRVSVVNY